MKAEDIFETLKPNVQKLTRTEKKRLYLKIFSEAHPAFRVSKRGKKRSLGEIKGKLKRDLQLACLEEKTIDSRA